MIKFGRTLCGSIVAFCGPISPLSCGVNSQAISVVQITPLQRLQFVAFTSTSQLPLGQMVVMVTIDLWLVVKDMVLGFIVGSI